MESLDHKGLEALRAENARLIALLEAHDIEWRLPPEPAPVAAIEAEPSNFSSQEKVALFVACFVVAPMSIRFAGKVKLLAKLATRLLARMNGDKAYAISHASSVPIAVTAC